MTLQLDSIYFLHPLQFPVIPCFIRTIVLPGWRGTSFVTGWDEKTVHAGGETFSSHLPLQRWPSKSHPGAPDLGHWRGNGLWKNHTDSTVPSRRCKFWNEPMNDFSRLHATNCSVKSISTSHDANVQFIGLWVKLCTERTLTFTTFFFNRTVHMEVRWGCSIATESSVLFGVIFELCSVVET